MGYIFYHQLLIRETKSCHVVHKNLFASFSCRPFYLLPHKTPNNGKKLTPRLPQGFQTLPLASGVLPKFVQSKSLCVSQILQQDTTRIRFWWTNVTTPHWPQWCGKNGAGQKWQEAKQRAQSLRHSSAKWKNRW